MGTREACRTLNIQKKKIWIEYLNEFLITYESLVHHHYLQWKVRNVLKGWVINTAKYGFSVNKETHFPVSKMAEDTGKVPFKDGLPHQTWYKNFLKRNPEISLRKAEGIKKARAILSEEIIRKWFRELNKFLVESNLSDVLDDPDRVFYGDESGFALCPKIGKVLGPKGFKSLYNIKLGNEKENITVLIVFNAAGKIAPPLVLFPYVEPPRVVVEGMPKNWILGKSDKGWMTTEVFFEYIANEFLKWVLSENVKRPIIVFVDVHKSHMTYDLSQWCQKNQVIFSALLPTSFNQRTSAFLSQ